MTWTLQGDGLFFQTIVDTASVPEPTSLALVGIGTAAMALGGWRRRKG